MDLETRMKIDLGELLYCGQITNALAVEKEFGVSSRAIPGYYAGDRDAKTVIVMLNPGNDAQKAVYDSMPELTLFRYLGLEAFFQKKKAESRNAGYSLGSILDYFDLKTAAFLSAWYNSGIVFPDGFITSKQYAPITDDKNIRIEANRNCLNQKLQLELLPYPSSEFTGIKKGNVNLLVPFVETLLEEIFSVERKYIIFAGNGFETIFNFANFNQMIKVGYSCSTKLMKIGNNGKLEETKTEFRCTLITLKYGNNKPIIAIIANTFPNQALSRALGLMYQYGKFCYETFFNYKQQNP